RPLAKGPGQKETRYVHLFKVFDETTVEDHSASELMAPNQKLRLEERVTKLEDELTALREEFDKLMRELS
ncbi:MAG: DUF480 domain-containing protein, partial [Sphingobacteriaceae bacterium]